MQDIIKRYFWVVGAAAVMLCAVFAAKATGNIAAATVLADPAHGPAIQAAMPSPMQPAKLTRSKDGTAFAQRDIFCSDCAPAVPDNPVATDPSMIAMTNLPLVLLATNVGATEEQSYATIINTETQMQGSYAIGDKIPGATGALKEIHYKYIDFENSGHTERLALAGATLEPTPAPKPNTTAPANDEDAAVDNGIHKTGDGTFEIDKGLVDRMLANPMAMARGARIVPSIKNGKPDGFKLYAIRPNSAFAKLGLMNGDTLQSINGFTLDSADSALNAYTKLRSATSLELDVERRGQQLSLRYTIR
jgi:general secretion pathway protein C